MKPDWKDAPEWAQYSARDEDGRWFWHQAPPYFIDYCGAWRSIARWEPTGQLGDGSARPERRP